MFNSLIVMLVSASESKQIPKQSRFSSGRNDIKVFTPQGTLTTHEKKRILLSNIYGVDLDANAVEVTKLSLLLKCMEGETEASIKQQITLFHERVLPDPCFEKRRNLFIQRMG